MPKQDVHADRARKLIEALKHQREQGTNYPLTVSQLRDLADPQATDEELFKALTKKPYAEQIVLAAKKDLGSPIALAEDAGTLAASPLLLEFALGKLATAESPVHAVAKVVGKTDKALQHAFEASLNEQLATGTLPERVGQHEVKGKVLLYLKQFPPPPPPPPKKKPAAALSEQLLAALTARQEQDAVPLADLVEPEVKPALVKKAVAEEPFRSQAVLLPISKTLTLVATASKRETALAGDRVLLALLDAKTTLKKPYASLALLAEGLPEAQREMFLVGQGARAEAGTLPKTVLAQPEEGSLVLGLKQNLPHRVLAEQLFAGLRLARDAGVYPLPLRELLARINAPADDKLVKSALALGPTWMLAATPGSLDSLIVLAGDHERLAADPRLVEMALRSLRTPDNQAVPVADLGKKLAPELKPTFTATIEQQLHDHRLPAGVGALVIKKKPHLFLLTDLPPASPHQAGGARTNGEAQADPAATASFAERFAEAFEKLDRATGAHGLVSLVELRQAVPLEREQFNAELNTLRRLGLYTLTAAESREGVRPEEREAGIVEHGHLLLYVSRRDEG